MTSATCIRVANILVAVALCAGLVAVAGTLLLAIHAWGLLAPRWRAWRVSRPMSAKEIAESARRWNRIGENPPTSRRLLKLPGPTNIVPPRHGIGPGDPNWCPPPPPRREESPTLVAGQAARATIRDITPRWTPPMGTPPNARRGA